jgi:hypothetical protein
MSTRSAIILKVAPGQYAGIYCHNDGYVKEPGVGHLLHTHYRDPLKIAGLIALGFLSELGSEIGEEHDFNERRAHGPTPTTRNWCLAYHRDRGEWLERVPGPTWLHVAYDIAHDGYVYVYEDGTWSVARGGSEFLEPLADVLAVLSGETA